MLPYNQWINRPYQYATPDELRHDAAAPYTYYINGKAITTNLRVEDNTWGIALVRKTDGVGVGFWRDPAWKLPTRSGVKGGKRGEGKWNGNEHLFHKGTK